MRARAQTHQGRGDATRIYKKYGKVCSFEKNRDKYDSVLERFSQHIFIDHFNDINDAIDTYSNEFIFLYSKPIDSRDALKILNNYNIHFDVIDVDPYGLPLPFFPDVYHLLKDISILFVTTGEMHYRWDYDRIFSDYKFKDDDIKTLKKIFLENIGSFLSAKLSIDALKYELGLFPIFFHDYHINNSGVHRVGFYVKKNLNYKEKYHLRELISADPNLKIKRTNFTCDCSNYNKPWKFSPQKNKDIVNKGIINRLMELSSINH